MFFFFFDLGVQGVGSGGESLREVQNGRAERDWAGGQWFWKRGCFEEVGVSNVDLSVLFLGLGIVSLG